MFELVSLGKGLALVSLNEGQNFVWVYIAMVMKAICIVMKRRFVNLKFLIIYSLTGFV